ncbi:hypothetical protein, partial [Pseudomonas prosekii]|uniref:hypothetical protein n=1 Tax=Pseudomonas prosekii TaxID=1148509 RepID=UPI001C7DF34C
MKPGFSIAVARFGELRGQDLPAMGGNALSLILRGACFASKLCSYKIKNSCVLARKSVASELARVRLRSSRKTSNRGTPDTTRSQVLGPLRDPAR